MMICFFSSCVHQFPDPGKWRRVRIHVSHETEWTYHQIHLKGEDTRALDSERLESRYTFCIFRSGEQTPVVTEVMYRGLNESLDFDVELMVPAGVHEVRVWHDYVVSGLRTDHMYVIDHFGSIRFNEPFMGGMEEKDAFAGTAIVDVPYSDNYDVYVETDPVLRRPLSAYAFVTTDVQKFLKNRLKEQGSSAPAQNEPIIDFSELDQYRIRAIYTGYYAHTYSHFDDNPIRATVGVSYEARITVLDENEAMLCFDHVMVNGEESYTSVQLEIYDGKGQLVVRSQPLDLPVKRSRITVVRGEFLTSNTEGAAGIDASFDGQYIVEIH